ncbi:MAG TPA: cation acetate symporter [Candidatus Dormibacteraeota bacterium]|nr:cation acetate symporter [Candidatus Dormibacteraeota bacterium]
MTTTLWITAVIVAITLGITVWAARQTRTTVQFYAAGRKIKAWQNGLAIAGDYMSAASFLGIAGLIAFNGYDGFMYSVGWLVAYLTVLLLIAEPIRNTGKYTMADVLSYRMSAGPVRSAAAISTLAVSGFYMIAQMVGAGVVLHLLVPNFSFQLAVVIVGILMIGYVVLGGMIATTWVQIVKATLLMAGAILLSIMVLSHFGFNPLRFFDAIAKVVDAKSKLNFTQPGILYPHGKHVFLGPLTLDKSTIENVSLGMALIFGTAGLPHILMRFYTVPTARAARTSVGWAMGLIGAFYVMTTFLGFGAAVLVGKKAIGNSNLAAPKLAEFLGGGPNSFGGELLLGFISAVAFATILAVVAGLTLAASSAFAHDFWMNVVRGGKESESEQVTVARIAAVGVGVIAVLVAINLPTANAAQLVAAAFAVASSGNLPVILFTLFWKRFNTVGAVFGLIGGTAVSILLIVIGPGLNTVPAAHPAFALSNPGIVSIPLGFLFAIVGTYIGEALGGDQRAAAMYPEIAVRSQTGVGAEPSSVVEERVPAAV